MSQKRVVVACAAVTLAGFAGPTNSLDAHPMMQARGVVQPAPQTVIGGEPGPVERRAKPITPENPIPRRTLSVNPPNPENVGPELVQLRVTIDEQGGVAEVRAPALNTARMPVVSAAPDDKGRVSTNATKGSESIVKSAIEAVRQWRYEPPVDGPIAFDVTFSFVPGMEGRLITRDAQPGRTGGNIGAPTKLKHVPPVYPEEARQAHVEGVVIIESVIGPDGRISDARILRSIPLLDQAALDAVKQWEFTPTVVNGQPVPVLMTMTVQFSLTR